MNWFCTFSSIHLIPSFIITNMLLLPACRFVYLVIRRLHVSYNPSVFYFLSLCQSLFIPLSPIFIDPPPPPSRLPIHHIAPLSLFRFVKFNIMILTRRDLGFFLACNGWLVVWVFCWDGWMDGCVEEWSLFVHKLLFSLFRLRFYHCNSHCRLSLSKSHFFLLFLLLPSLPSYKFYLKSTLLGSWATFSPLLYFCFCFCFCFSIPSTPFFFFTFFKFPLPFSLVQSISCSARKMFLLKKNHLIVHRHVDGWMDGLYTSLGCHLFDIILPHAHTFLSSHPHPNGIYRLYSVS